MEPMNVSATMHATGVQQVQRELIHYLVISVYLFVCFGALIF